MEDREGEPFNTTALKDQLSVMSYMWFHQHVVHDGNVYLNKEKGIYLIVH